MKWLLLALALAIAPTATARARRDVRTRELLAVLVGFLPFFNIDLNIISDPTYRGDTRGLELSLVDLVAWMLMAALPRARKTPYRLVVIPFITIAFASALWAARPMFAIFGAIKFVRLFVLCIAAERIVRANLGGSLLRGLAAGVVYVCVIAFKQRYLEGMMQVHGPFVHQNGIGMTADMVTPGLVGLALAGYGGRLALAGIAGGALAIVLSLSRGALLMMPMAWAMVYVGSLRRQVTGRKLLALALALAAASVVLIKAMDSLVDRFSNAPDASRHARDLFEASAHAMLDEHPLGIGLNQFSYVQAHDGYADRFEIPEIDRDGIVHNIYRLTGAELGYLGLWSFELMLATPLVLALLTLRRHWKRKDPRVDLMLGLAASLTVTYLHSTLEWAMRITPIAQVLWLGFGFVAGLATSLRDSYGSG